MGLLHRRGESPNTFVGNTEAYLNGEPMEQAAEQRSKGSTVKGFILGVVVTVAVGAAGCAYLMFSADDSAINTASMQKLQMLERQINAKYYQADSLTTEQLEDGMYKGLLESLDDPYSTYYTAEEVEDLAQSLEGTYSGIGAYISTDQDTNYAKISGVIADSPAEAAGLLANDIIYKVDGEDTFGLSLDEVVSRVRGEKGTDVTLTIARSGETDYLEFTITRDDVDSPTVSSQVLDDDIGYLQITEFDGVTTNQFKKELQSLYDENVKGLIIDLRNNPGGDVDVVTAIANEIIPEGLVFYMEDRDGKRTEYTADGKNAITIPLVVLVNGNSASASEILTGAVQDSGCGTVVGTQTYGKGVVQSVYSLLDGTAVKLTIANYYTRGGNNINKVGITPDVEVELDAEQYLKDGTDTQLQTAISTLLDQLD